MSNPNQNTDPMGKAMDAVFKSSSLALLQARSMDKDSAFLEGARRVLQYMHELWQTGRMCDVTMDCMGGSLKAHKIALSAYSEQLARRFMEYPVGEQVNINLKDFSKNTVHTILVFVYTTDMAITQDNVGELLACASELGITFVRQTCIEFLKYLTPQNVLIYMEIAERHGLEELMPLIQNFMRTRFGEIMSSPALLGISAEKLIMLLSSDHLTVPGGELEVFRLVVRWIEYNRPERLPLAPHLLRMVRLNLISPADLVNHVEKVDFILSIRECFQQLYSAMSYHALKSANIGSDDKPGSGNRISYHSQLQWTALPATTSIPTASPASQNQLPAQ